MPQPIWVTPAGNFGTYTEGSPINYTFVATPSNISYTLEYTILNGTFPNATIAFTLNSSTGVLTGTPDQVKETTTYSFTIRVKEYNGPTYMSFTDRTFSFNIQGPSPPTFITPAGALYAPYLLDSTWDPVQILISNTDPGTTAVLRIASGFLPPGLEFKEDGTIQGYAYPPFDSLGNPTSKNYSFVIEVKSESGIAARSYSILVNNQETVPGFTGRPPAILNTRPPSDAFLNLLPSDYDLPFYINSSGNIGIVSQDNYFIFRILSYNFAEGPLSYSFSGTLPSGLSTNINYNSTNTIITVNSTLGGSGYVIGDQLKILGSAVDGIDGVNDILFTVDTVGTAGKLLTVTGISGLNLDAQENYQLIDVTTVTGLGSGAKVAIQKINASWIDGNITTSPSLYNTYTFTYTAIDNLTTLTSDPITFSITVVGEVDNIPFDPAVNWTTDSNLGTLYNTEISTLYVEATSVAGYSLEYTIVSGSLPPDLSLALNGEINGRASFETESTVTPAGTSNTYIFTIQAQNPTVPIITSTKTFTLTIYQISDVPYENMYARAFLTDSDEIKLASLLEDTDIIPTNYLYRPTNPFFGRATVDGGILYQHMYGVVASEIANYAANMDENFYWKNIVLGPIKTALAKNDAGDIIYEVVYSEIVDDLINNEGQSVSKQINWPNLVNGVATTVYPNSLPNMRTQIEDTLGQENQDNLLPIWMTSLQPNGASLGFTPAWVICYTKPGYSEYIKNNIVSPFTGTIEVFGSDATDDVLQCTSTAGFYPNMKIEFTGTVFGGVIASTPYYVHTIESGTLFTISATPFASSPMALTDGDGSMQLSHITWEYTLNELTFILDRFILDRSFSWEYDPTTTTWSSLPSDVIETNVEDAYVYFPQKNILN